MMRKRRTIQEESNKENKDGEILDIMIQSIPQAKGEEKSDITNQE